MNINELTIGQAREIASIIGGIGQPQQRPINCMIGKNVIIRTYSAGVWYGILYEKDGHEVILKNARRMWYWVAAESISLSACALFGIDQEKSKIVSPVEYVWLEAIEIIPCSDKAAASIDGAPYVKAK